MVNPILHDAQTTERDRRLSHTEPNWPRPVHTASNKRPTCRSVRWNCRLPLSGVAVPEPGQDLSHHAIDKETVKTFTEKQFTPGLKRRGKLRTKLAEISLSGLVVFII